MPADLPRALREFYQPACQRPGMLGRQNRILPATELRPGVDPRQVVFGEENQLCFHWELDPAEVAPVVWLTAAEDSAEREPLNGLLMQFSLFEAMAGAPYQAQARYPPVPEPLVQGLTDRLRPVPFRPWRWPADPTTFHAAPGLIACTSDLGDGMFEITIGAQHRGAPRPFGELASNVVLRRMTSPRPAITSTRTSGDETAAGPVARLQNPLSHPDGTFAP